MRSVRLIALFLFAASGVCLGWPQDSTPALEPNVTQDWLQHFKDKKEMHRKPLPGRLWRHRQPPATGTQRYDCFHIHSFNFEKGGRESPRLESETTCTPNRVKLLLVPQTLDSPRK